MKIYCKSCGCQLSFNNVAVNRVNIDGTRLGRFCRTCAEELENKLRDTYFVEEYDHSIIYSLDGKYVPYWGCHYYFQSIEDCRGRIDNKNYTVVSRDALSRLFWDR